MFLIRMIAIILDNALTLIEPLSSTANYYHLIDPAVYLLNKIFAGKNLTKILLFLTAEFISDNNS